MSPSRALGSTLVLAAALAAPPRGALALPVLDRTSRTAEQVAVASPEPLRTPAEVVAARARDLLRDHADRRAWGALAVALPSVAAVGGRGPDATVEATRVVEEMLNELPPQEAGRDDSSTRPVVPSPALEVPSPSLAVSSPSAGGSDRRSIGEMIDVLASALALLLGVFALAMVMKGAGSALRPTTSSATPDRGRHRDVRLMAARGLQAHEIARRTGLARDAVSVLINRKAG